MIVINATYTETRKLTIDNDYAGTQADNLSTEIQFTIPERLSAFTRKIVWDVYVEDIEGNRVQPAEILTGDSYRIPNGVLNATSNGVIRFQLVFYDAYNNVMEASELTKLRVADAVSGTVTPIPESDYMDYNTLLDNAHTGVEWNGLQLTFSTIKGDSQTITIPWDKLEGSVKNNAQLWTYLSKIATLLPYDTSSMTDAQYVYWDNGTAKTRPIDTADVQGLLSDLSAINSRIDGLMGAYVIIGRINQNAPTDAQLTARAIEIKGTAPTIGWVLIDTANTEWYWNGSAWDNLGQYLIAEADSATMGIMRLHDAVSTDEQGTWTGKLLNTELNKKAKDADLTAHIANENVHVDAVKQAYWNQKLNPESIADMQVKSQRGIANGYPSLGSDAKVPKVELPDDVQYTNQKAQANGYAGLDGTKKVPKTQLPADIEYTFRKDQASGYAGIQSNGKIQTRFLDTGSGTNQLMQSKGQPSANDIPYYDSVAQGIKWRPMTAGGKLMGSVETYADLPLNPANNEMWYVEQTTGEYKKGIWAYALSGWVNVQPDVDMTMYQLISNLVQDLDNPDTDTYISTAGLALELSDIESEIAGLDNVYVLQSDKGTAIPVLNANGAIVGDMATDANTSSSLATIYGTVPNSALRLISAYDENVGSPFGLTGTRVNLYINRRDANNGTVLAIAEGANPRMSTRTITAGTWSAWRYVIHAGTWENNRVAMTGTERGLLAYSTVTKAELEYLSGVTSNIQTQINNLALVPFTNAIMGGIKGSALAGRINAQADGTGLVNGINEKFDKAGGTLTGSINIKRSIPSLSFIDTSLPAEGNPTTPRWYDIVLYDSDKTTVKSHIRSGINPNGNGYTRIRQYNSSGAYAEVNVNVDAEGNRYVTTSSRSIPGNTDVATWGQVNERILTSAKGQPNGVASLDATGKVPQGQLPSMGGHWEKVATDITSFGFENNGVSVNDMVHIRVKVSNGKYIPLMFVFDGTITTYYASAVIDMKLYHVELIISGSVSSHVGSAYLLEHTTVNISGSNVYTDDTSLTFPKADMWKWVS